VRKSRNTAEKAPNKNIQIQPLCMANMKGRLNKYIECIFSFAWHLRAGLCSSGVQYGRISVQRGKEVGEVV
jgi:hypothetical protein